MADALDYEPPKPKLRRPTPMLDVVAGTGIGLLIALPSVLLAESGGRLGRVVEAVIVSPFGTGRGELRGWGIPLWCLFGGLAGGAGAGVRACRWLLLAGLAVHYLVAAYVVAGAFDEPPLTGRRASDTIAAVASLIYVLAHAWLWTRILKPARKAHPARTSR
ncbi:MAG TPA: hypothetical protein VF796_28695 [Humisphaera sp.]